MVTRSSVGVLSVISRSSGGVFREGIREVKETAILRKVLFSILEFLGSSLVRPWFFLGLLYDRDWQGTAEGNLNFRVVERTLRWRSAQCACRSLRWRWEVALRAVEVRE